MPSRGSSQHRHIQPFRGVSTVCSLGETSLRSDMTRCEHVHLDLRSGTGLHLVRACAGQANVLWRCKAKGALHDVHRELPLDFSKSCKTEQASSAWLGRRLPHRQGC